jgi:tetratricopeptide (TPR) repeat protein
MGLIHASTSKLKGRTLFVWGQGKGGQRWQEFLSVRGHRYIEIQAGLASTQLQCLPMAPKSQWCWLEAYGMVKADPVEVHSSDWNNACAAVENELDRFLPQEWLDDQLEETRKLADTAPTEFLTFGSGWGALEKNRREHAGQTRMHPSGIIFPEKSTSDEQRQWQALLKSGLLPYAKPENYNGSWMVQPEWIKIVERSLENKGGDHWLSRLHLGVMYYQCGKKENAKAEWERSLKHEPSALAYRNLAVFAKDQNDAEQSVEFYRRAYAMGHHLKGLLLEYLEALRTVESFDEMLEVLEGLDVNERAKGRICYYESMARLGKGQINEAELLLNDIVMADLREGESCLTDLWFELQARKMARQQGKQFDDSLLQSVRRNMVPPQNLDFRVNLDKG